MPWGVNGSNDGSVRMSEELIRRLTEAVGAQALLTDAADMAPHLTDWRGRYSGEARCVVKPACAAGRRPTGGAAPW